MIGLITPYTLSPIFDNRSKCQNHVQKTNTYEQEKNKFSREVKDRLEHLSEHNDLQNITAATLSSFLPGQTTNMYQVI